MPHSQPTALQQTVCKFHLDPQYHISHWGSTILGNSTLCIKAHRYWPLWGEHTDYRRIPLTKGQWRGNVSIWWRLHDIVMGRNPIKIKITFDIRAIRWHPTAWLNRRYIMPHQIANCMGPTSGPHGSCRPQMDPMLATWTLLSGSVQSILLSSNQITKQTGWWNQTHAASGLQ